ncbi:DNA replication/repair protein RecF [Tianweitania populi]|uniref:DNA replication and repair protein RecF n=1 Tax=Tianweitania populi TaxID=1607949 RepID=A0A8J3DV02_9HYPH|nr:DNA replication/repair protein RecF [Tianweitania populi]GHD15421.1 DNA replication and repair protein RecF [Tianweitania populi]
MAEPSTIGKFQLTQFRNYAQLVTRFEPGAVVLFGANGAGKTNLLEAISFLSPGRGLRRASYRDVPRAGAADGFSIFAEVSGPEGDASIGTGTGSDNEGDAARRVRINGAPARSADDLLEWLRVIWLTPSMDTLFTGPAADRRRFVDRLVLAIDPQHGRRTLDYEKAMRGRNRLLAEDSRDTAWLDAIETQMAETGTAIAVARVELVRLLTGLIETMPDGAPFPRAGIALTGFVEDQVAGRAAVDIEESFRQALRANRYRDRASGRTLDGPHRADFVVEYREKAMPAALCSTGEQKALLIGLILSHARLTGAITGLVPILLLDEIAAHLDENRRAALFSILEEIGCQTFMTGTERALFASLETRAQFLHVQDGTVTADPG